MAQVFLSYSREDRDRVKPLVAALETENISVWWDRDLVPGDSFEETIDSEIRQAECIVVVWSDHSVNSQWVKNEALEGLDRKILVPLRLDDVRIPVAFKQTQGADFTRWPETVDEEEYRKFLNVILTKLNQDACATDLKGLQTMKPRGRSRFRRKRDWVLPGVIVAAALTVAISFNLRDPVAVSEATIPRLSVVPFTDGSGPESKFYADSMTSELTRRFSTFDDLELVHVGSVWDLDLASVPQAIIEEDSDFSLTGLVSTDAEQVTVEARLRDLSSDLVVWQSNYTNDADNLLELQQRMVLGVISHLKLSSADDFSVQKLNAVTTDKSAYRDYLRGVDLLRRGEQHNVYLAIEKFEDALRKDPGFAIVQAALCRAFLESYQATFNEEEYTRGKHHCDAALQMDSTQGDVQLALAELYRTSGDNELSKYHYTRVLELDTRNADATMGLAAIFGSEGDFRAAEELYQKATRLQPTYWKAQNQLGSFYFRQGLYFQAIESYLRVTQLTTVNATAFNNLGAAQFSAGHFDDAYESWRQASDLFTDSAAYSNMGTALYLLGRYEEALKEFETAIKMDPNDHRMWGNAGDNMRFLSIEEGRISDSYQKAIDLAQSNLSINPNDPYTTSRLAVYYAALGNAETSNQYIQRAKILAAADFNVLYDLGVASSLLGDHETAKKYALEALDAGYPEIILVSDPQFAELELLND